MGARGWGVGGRVLDRSEPITAAASSAVGVTFIPIVNYPVNWTI